MPRALVFHGGGEFDYEKGEWPDEFKTYVSLSWQLEIYQDSRSVQEMQNQLKQGKRTEFSSYNDLIKGVGVQGKTIVSKIKALKRKNPVVHGFMSQTKEFTHAVFNVDGENVTFDVLCEISGHAW
jgi:hypothetical protein